jgi:predicted flap endonuclease-1-like 5' DNA nuclease
MSALACCIWWFLLGLLLGWLLNWLLSRWTRKDVVHSTSPVAAYVAPAPAPVRAAGADITMAALAGFSIKGNDDLPIIEGIGPKISELLKNNGVTTFDKLSRMSVPEISAILASGGARFKLANPGSWAQQARLCHENRWTELKTLQDELYAGVDAKEVPDDSNGPKA